MLALYLYRNRSKAKPKKKTKPNFLVLCFFFASKSRENHIHLAEQRMKPLSSPSEDKRRHPQIFGIFGGAFDPVGRHHILIADLLVKHRVVDHVLFVPCYRSFSGKKMCDFSHRVKMCQLALRDRPHCSIVDTESKFPECQTSYDLLVRMFPCLSDSAPSRESRMWRGEVPKSPPREFAPLSSSSKSSHRFKFIVGLDNALTLPSWRKGEVLKSLLPIIVVGREGIPLPSPSQAWFTHAPHQFVPLHLPASSTQIRTALVDTLVDSGEMLDPSVQTYIEKHKLYT